MKRPRIYGSETKFRTAVTRYMRSAEELLDQAQGVQNRLDSLTGDLAEFQAITIEEEWSEDVRRWFRTARRGLIKYLQGGLEGALPTLALGLPPATGKPRHAIALDNGVPWLERAREDLQDLQKALGVRRDVVAKAGPVPARFQELRESGLIEANVIDDYSKEVSSPRTPGQLHHAIGAAKELTEATLRAALDQLGETYRSRDGLQDLMQKWRKAIGKVASPDVEGEAALDKAQAALANLVVFLAEWRNKYGRGHGPTRYPPGLAARHARLASDAAETCVRFIVTTMDDLQLLPP